MQNDDEKPFALQGAPEKPGPNATKSLHGEGHANATRTRECVAMPGLREQEILTPPSIIRALKALWPNGIALDPCCPTWCNPTGAARSYSGGEVDDGLREPWEDRTYANPPYGELKSWLATGLQWVEAGCDVVMLVPLRTHRKWFRLDAWDAVCFLDPLKFVGFDQAFPSALCVLYGGDDVAAFSVAFSPLGRCAQVVNLSHARQGVLL